MQFAILTLNLTEAYDAVTFDVLYQHQILAELYGKENVSLFASQTNQAVCGELDVGHSEDFQKWCASTPNGTVIFHYCDSRNSYDEILRSLPQRTIVRWHNNTPPWFNLDSQGQAIHAQLGYENLVDYINAPNVDFWVNSEFTAKQLRALGCEPSRVSVVFPGSRYLNNAQTPPPNRPESPPGFDLLFVGRVVPHKGHLNAIATANLLSLMSDEPVRLHIVGKRDAGMAAFHTRIEKQAASSSADIIFHGQISSEQLQTLYSTAHAFLCLSEHEGFGLPVFEAVRSGLPVVLWATSAFAELMEGHPFAFAHFDAGIMAAAVQSLKNSQNRDLVLSKQAAIASRYTPEIIELQLRSAINRLPTAPATSVHSSFSTMGLVDDDEIRSSLSRHYDEVSLNSFAHQPRIEHDSGNNLVSHYDLIQYRAYFDRARHARFAPLKSQAERQAFLAPDEFSFRDGKLTESSVNWHQGGYDGCLLWGPYFELPPGTYVASFHIEVLGNGLKGAVRLDVNGTKGVLIERSFAVREITDLASFELEFRVDGENDWLEFRVSAIEKFYGSIKFAGVTLVNKINQQEKPIPDQQVDIRFYRPEPNSSFRHIVDNDSIRWKTPVEFSDVLYRAPLHLPEGKYVLDVQVLCEGDGQSELTCRARSGGVTLSERRLNCTELSRFQPIRMDIDLKSPQVLTLELSMQGSAETEIRFAGVVLQSSDVSNRGPHVSKYLPSSLLTFRARSAAKRKQYAAAASLYAGVLQRTRGTPNLWTQYAHALKEAGRLSQAEAAYHRALDLSSENNELKLHLAHLYMRTARHAKARYFFSQILSHEEFSAEAETALAELNQFSLDLDTIGKSA
jgi:glycosyltransferase involved in cell wall biosynthesis